MLGAGKTFTVVGPSNSINPGTDFDGLLGRSLGTHLLTHLLYYITPLLTHS